MRKNLVCNYWTLIFLFDKKGYKLYTLAQKVRPKQALTHILLVLFKIVKVFQTVGAKKEMDR